MENCPNCKSKIKSGFFGSNSWTQQYKLDIINRYNEEKFDALCENCAMSSYPYYLELLKKEILKLNKEINQFKSKIIVSTNEPNRNWEYDFIDVVSSSITMGTSITTEITSTLTDIVGNESNKYRTIVESAEEECLKRIKDKAFSKKGNAIVGFRLNISEVGGLKGMILVSMYGTLIKIKNDTEFNQSFEDLSKKIEQLEYLNKLRDNVPQ